MKGLFIPGITAEMFRNGCLESIEELMTEGEIYDIDYLLEQEPKMGGARGDIPIQQTVPKMPKAGEVKQAYQPIYKNFGEPPKVISADLKSKRSNQMTREEAEEILLQSKMQCEYPHGAYGVAVDIAVKALRQEPKTDYKSFAEWVAGEIFSDNWEYNNDAFEEIACRKLSKLGIVTKTNDEWVYEGKTEQESKTGMWIERFDETDEWYECDQCHTDWDSAVNYCPNCGARMVGVIE